MQLCSPREQMGRKVQTGHMVYIGRLHGKGEPAYALEGVQDHGPTGTLCARLADWGLSEEGLVCGIWHQPSDGEPVADAVSLPGSRGADGLGAAVQHRFGVQRPVTIHEHGRLFSRHLGDSFILSRGSAQDTMRFARIPFAD